jgi:hypothetical protein
MIIRKAALALKRFGYHPTRLRRGSEPNDTKKRDALRAHHMIIF